MTEDYSILSMTVLILSTGLPSERYPLNGIFAFDQAKALHNAGVDVVFLSVDLRSIRRIRRWGYTHGTKEGIQWHNISVPVGPIDWIHKLISRSVVCRLYRKVFKDKKPDIIHAHFASNFAYYLGQKYNIPYVITEHSSSVNRDDLPVETINELKIYYGNAERVISVSSALGKRIHKYTGIVCSVIPNIIDTHLFACVEKVPHSGFNLVTTSNLIPLKRTINILQAIPNVLAAGCQIHLDIIGEGPMKGELLRFVSEKGIGSNITIHGLLKREEISRIYAKADCFVLPSTTETFGVAYVEAMAAGLPVIATKCGGPEDFVNDSNGLLIDVDNLQQLENAILYMYDHYQEYDEKAIRSSILKLFSPEVISTKLVNLYSEILG